MPPALIRSTVTPAALAATRRTDPWMRARVRRTRTADLDHAAPLPSAPGSSSFASATMAAVDRSAAGWLAPLTSTAAEAPRATSRATPAARSSAARPRLAPMTRTVTVDASAAGMAGHRSTIRSTQQTRSASPPARTIATALRRTSANPADAAARVPAPSVRRTSRAPPACARYLLARPTPTAPAATA
ncbi:MAG: hypothetical protein JWN48_1411 [Myxococcaceae bacterium]|nr:hypothetical protein [Myxococcaceae bacterium]